MSPQSREALIRAAKQFAFALAAAAVGAYVAAGGETDLRTILVALAVAAVPFFTRWSEGPGDAYRAQEGAVEPSDVGYQYIPPGELENLKVASTYKRTTY